MVASARVALRFPLSIFFLVDVCFPSRQLVCRVRCFVCSRTAPHITGERSADVVKWGSFSMTPRKLQPSGRDVFYVIFSKRSFVPLGKLVDFFLIDWSTTLAVF